MATQRIDETLETKELEGIKEEKLEEIFCTSDEFHDITCVPCSREKRNVSALKYCVECTSYMCEMCLNQHNRFGMMTSHHIVNIESAKELKNELPVQRCSEHHGKLLDMYCRHHDEACCAVCAALNHSTCKGVAYLPDVINDSECNKQECQETCDKIDRLQAELLQVKLARRQKYEIFENEKLKIITQLKCIRKLIDKRFDGLENKIRKQTDEETTRVEDIKMSDAKTLEHAELVLTDQKQTLERLSKTGNKASIFVQKRLANKSLKETEEIGKLLESMSVNHMYFLPNKSLGIFLEEVKYVGEIVENIPTYTAELHKIVFVKASSEKSVCTISGVCSLDNGEIIISDWQNKSLKRLDDNYTIVGDLELPGRPYGICTVDSSTIAVSLTKSKVIQFVSVDKTMKNTSSFSVGDACRGIAYSNGLLYVACGGWKIFGEGQGHIEVYTTSGVLQRKFGDHPSQPGHIDLAFSRLYVTDNKKNGLDIMDTNGHILKTFIQRDITNPLAVCAGPGNQLFLRGWSTHNIMLLSNKGQLLLTLLTQNNGLKDLHALYFDSLRSRLICTMRDTNKMKVFVLNFNT